MGQAKLRTFCEAVARAPRIGVHYAARGKPSTKNFDEPEFWDRKRNRVDDREIFDVLSVTGGVPRYLEEIDPGLSADENIRRLCFLSSGELYKDFDAIFDPELDPSVPLKRQILSYNFSHCNFSLNVQGFFRLSFFHICVLYLSLIYVLSLIL